MPFDPKKLEAYPIQPGVYMMKGANGHILYVGKANNLRQRLRQYFLPGGDGRFMVPFLIQIVEQIDLIVVGSEKEALLLENTLIKKHKPKFNALLKDDKSYIALRITHKHRWPVLQLWRYKGKPEASALYFGPYTSALAARATFDLLNRLFPLRQCSDQEFARRIRPCILYDMKRCLAPCVEKCTPEEYNDNVQRNIRFLRGQDKEIREELYKEMHKEADLLHFEKAAEILTVIRQIEQTIETQKVSKPLGIDCDAIAIFRHSDDAVIFQLNFRGGSLTGSRHFNFSNIAENDVELLESFLLQHYESMQELPHEILLPIEFENGPIISEILSKDKPRKALIYAPKKGEKKALVEMALNNAEVTYKKEKDQKYLQEKTLGEMQEKLHLKNFPRRIECFDNSHLSGDEPVSSLVAFTDGKKDTSRYRKYKIKEATPGDDYGAMREVLSRRCLKGLVENDLPDLIIIDGGKGHLNAVLAILSSLNIVTVDVIGVAKEEGRHDKGSTAEQIFIPNIKDPIHFRSGSPVLLLFQKIRDEAHRSAITFHRNRRSKKIIRSALDDIAGIGPKKRKLLLTHFGSIKRIKEATEEDLKALKGLSGSNIKALFDHFKD
ncbi:MAG: excinuclease ABC subunit UvrC [Parachlamydiaceae bacterium]|nr:excinuclease ABC subunit UvrC [Parachlamydiaceae bacterium]